MLSRSYDTSVHDSGRPTTRTEVAQDDVERLIAGELFSAIERQIHRIEDELAFAEAKRSEYPQTVFKERLIRCAQSLEISIRDIGHYLERRANEHIENFGLRER